MSDDRCGFEYDVYALPDVSVPSCDRPPLDGSDRCIWHAGVDQTTLDVLSESAPSPGESLVGAQVRHVSLRGVDWFRDCTLTGTRFENVDLQTASFAGSDLRNATIRSSDLRGVDLSATNLEGAEVKDVDLRGADFTDARLNQTVFDDVRVDRTTRFGDRAVYERELDARADTDVETYREAMQAAVWSYRRVGELFEANGLPAESRAAHYREKDAQRRGAWRTADYFEAATAEVSRWLTGYGMSPWRVLGSSLVLILVSGLLYPVTGGIQESVGDSAITWEVENPGQTVGNATNATETGTPTDAGDAASSGGTPTYLATVLFKSLYFSVITFSTLGYGDIQPVGTGARAIAATESFLGSLLLALLVFVLTRRIS